MKGTGKKYGTRGRIRECKPIINGVVYVNLEKSPIKELWLFGGDRVQCKKKKKFRGKL